MKIRMFLAVLTVLIFGVTVVFAQDEEQTPPFQEKMGGPGLRMMAQLKVTDEQKKEMEKMRFDMAKQAIDRQAKIETARVEVDQLFRADNPDKAAIEKKINEISQFQAQGKLAHVNHWFAVNKMLTPDQQKIWKHMLGQAVAMKMNRKHQMRQNFQRPAIRGQMMERMQERMMQEHDQRGR